MENFLVLLGRNGSGKTTLLSLLASILKPSKGKVLVDSLDPSGNSDIRKLIGIISHNTYCYDRLSAFENLGFFATLYGINDWKQTALKLLNEVGLYEVRNKLVETFSRGMQQRLAIARAMITSPRVLLLDEPFTGLDEEGSIFLQKYLKSRQTRDTTIIMTTHDLEKAYKLGDEIAILHRGIISSLGQKSSYSQEELKAKYLSFISDNQ